MFCLVQFSYFYYSLVAQICEEDQNNKIIFYKNFFYQQLFVSTLILKNLSLVEIIVEWDFVTQHNVDCIKHNEILYYLSHKI